MKLENTDNFIWIKEICRLLSQFSGHLNTPPLPFMLMIVDLFSFMMKIMKKHTYHYQYIVNEINSQFLTALCWYIEYYWTGEDCCL